MQDRHWKFVQSPYWNEEGKERETRKQHGRLNGKEVWSNFYQLNFKQCYAMNGASLNSNLHDALSITEICPIQRVGHFKAPC